MQEFVLPSKGVLHLWCKTTLHYDFCRVSSLLKTVAVILSLQNWVLYEDAWEYRSYRHLGIHRVPWRQMPQDFENLKTEMLAKIKVADYKNFGGGHKSQDSWGHLWSFHDDFSCVISIPIKCSFLWLLNPANCWKLLDRQCLPNIQTCSQRLLMLSYFPCRQQTPRCRMEAQILLCSPLQN